MLKYTIKINLGWTTWVPKLHTQKEWEWSGATVTGCELGTSRHPCYCVLQLLLENKGIFYQFVEPGTNHLLCYVQQTMGYFPNLCRLDWTIQTVLLWLIVMSGKQWDISPICVNGNIVFSEDWLNSNYSILRFSSEKQIMTWIFFSIYFLQTPVLSVSYAILSTYYFKTMTH